ncbi:hypothetical protein ACPZ19_50530 [Amycolatopsis lurida]
MTAPNASPLAFLWVSPEFDQLEILLARGWTFDPGFDDRGELERVKGIFIWRTDGVVDAVRIKGRGDAAAMRCNRAGELLWEREGTTADVLGDLLELPPPSDPRAPRLVRAVAPQLWTP